MKKYMYWSKEKRRRRWHGFLAMMWCVLRARQSLCGALPCQAHAALHPTEDIYYLRYKQITFAWFFTLSCLGQESELLKRLLAFCSEFVVDPDFTEIRGERLCSASLSREASRAE